MCVRDYQSAERQFIAVTEQEDQRAERGRAVEERNQLSSGSDVAQGDINTSPLQGAA